MKWCAAGALAAGAVLISPIPAGATPDTQCRLTAPVQEVSTVSDIPLALRQLIGPIAEVGAPFNSTDAILDPTLPGRRMIRAGHVEDDWFVWYEHGGIAYFWQAVVARVPSDGGPATALANAETISDTLCAVTDGALAGSVPPYPPGAWESRSY